MQLAPDVIAAIQNPPTKVGCPKCRFVGCKSCRGFTLAEQQIYERQYRLGGDTGGLEVENIVPETREKEEVEVEEELDVDGSTPGQALGGNVTSIITNERSVNGMRMLTEFDFTSSLEGKDVMVFWGQRFKAWYRATVTRFDEKGRKATLYYPRDGYKEALDWRKVKGWIAGGRIKLVTGEVTEELEEESEVSQNDDEELDLSQELSQEPGLRYVGKEEFGVGLVGRTLSVYWGRGFNDWFRAKVERFEKGGRLRLYYAEDRYRETMDARKFGNLVDKARVKLVEGEDEAAQDEVVEMPAERTEMRKWQQGSQSGIDTSVAAVVCRRAERETSDRLLLTPTRFQKAPEEAGCPKCRWKGCPRCRGYTMAEYRQWCAQEGIDTEPTPVAGEPTPKPRAARPETGGSDGAGAQTILLSPSRFQKAPEEAGCPKCRWKGCPTCRGYTMAEYRQWCAQEGVGAGSAGAAAASRESTQDNEVEVEEEDAETGQMSPLVTNNNINDSNTNKGRKGSEPPLTPSRFTIPPERDGCPKCRYRGCRNCRGYTKAELRRWQEQEGIIPSPQAAKPGTNVMANRAPTAKCSKPSYTQAQLKKWQEQEGIIPSPSPPKKEGVQKRQRSLSSTAKATVPTAKSLRFLPIEDERFELGDDVLIATDDRILQHNLEQEDESFICHECHGHGEPSNQLLECAKCMHAYHQHCLKSPLSSIPEGLWICDDCLSGERIESCRPLTSAREFFLQQKGLALGRIESISEQNGEYFITCRWFCLPEETHVGRQSNHTAREVFLASHKNQVTAEAIYRRAKVVSLSEFSSSGDVDEDMFICDYEYDYQWKRFYRISEWDQQNDYGFGSDSEDDEARDTTFKLTLDLMREDGGGHSRGKKKRKLQGGHFGVTLQLGASDIADRSLESLANGTLEAENDVIKASRALSLATIPEYMPCREEQQEQIEDFMRNVIVGSSSSRNKAGKCLYISGIPGTGKTACVMDIVRNMTQSGNRNFHFIEINGLQLPSPMHVYSKLCEALTGETVGPSTAVMALEDLFTGKSQKEFKHGHHIIVLLDEMDSIVNKSQKALYNLFDWPSNPASNLSIIGIANTMDLPERLHPRIASRLAANKVVFHPYQKDDLQTIVQARLEAFDTLFDNAALQYAARKVANCSGDLRRCLELCRRALEVAVRRADGVTEGLQVRARDIDAAAKEAYNSPSIKMLAGCTRDQLMLMAAICLECQYAGAENETVILEDVFHRLNGSFPGYSVALPVLLHTVSNLGSSKLILCDGVSNRLGCKISLNVVKEDLKYVLSDESRSAVERNAGGRLT